MSRAKNNGSAIAGPWQVKGVNHETREAVRQAAKRAGLPIGEWVDRALRHVATEELTGRNTLPANLEDQLAAISTKLDDLRRPWWQRFRPEAAQRAQRRT
jgi:localization factor PodJL